MLEMLLSKQVLYVGTQRCIYLLNLATNTVIQFLSDTQWSMSILSIANMFTSRHPFGNAIVKVWVKAGHLKHL